MSRPAPTNAARRHAEHARAVQSAAALDAEARAVGATPVSTQAASLRDPLDTSLAHLGERKAKALLQAAGFVWVARKGVWARDPAANPTRPTWAPEQTAPSVQAQVGPYRTTWVADTGYAFASTWVF